MSNIEADMKHDSKPVKKRRGLFILLIIGLILVMSVAGLITGYSFVMKCYENSAEGENLVIDPEVGKRIEIPMGSSTTDISELLKKEGVIKNTTMFKVLSKLNGFDGTYQSGVHIISRETDYNSLKGLDTLMRILADRPLDNPAVKVTIPEGFTFNQTMERLYSAELEDKSRLIDKKKFKSIAESEKFDYKFMTDIPMRENRLEGYLFPDTYIFDTKGGEKRIIAKMLDQFDKIFRTDYYTRAEALEMTVDEIVILASIVEREAKDPDEMERIAGVIYNRLKGKNESLKKLQVDATIQYVMLNSTGSVKENLTEEDLKIDSPYNTYLYEGLPPSPICSPGKLAILAALFPNRDGNYLYYVAKNDGTGGHYFSKTYNEHLKNKTRSEQNKQKLKKNQ